MRIALCISGMMRTYQNCFPTVIEHIIRANPQHQFDTFIATWDVHGRNPVWWEISKDNTPVDFNKMHEDFGQSMNIKQVLIERFENSDFMTYADMLINTKYAGRTGERSNPHNYLPMVYKISQAYQLCNHHMLNMDVKYDLVVRMRSDLFFSSQVEFHSAYVHEIYMPQVECWGPANLNDQFAYGEPHTMAAYCAQWAFVDHIYKHINSLHPESQLAKLFELCKLVPIKQPINYRIER